MDNKNVGAFELHSVYMANSLMWANEFSPNTTCPHLVDFTYVFLTIVVL